MKKTLSRFIRPVHPKTEIRPTRSSIEKILNAGWLGQTKIHGHRAQIHIPADHSASIQIFNRQGKPHKKELSLELEKELFRIFRPKKGWNVIDAEWLKAEEKIFAFDFLKKEDRLLNTLSFEQRWKKLPRDFLSPHLRVLKVFRKTQECLDALEAKEKWVEGLVFKSPSPGFEDSSIIRCRKSRP